jgi:hypothetical protein
MKIPKKRSVLFFPGIFIERTRVNEIISDYETEAINNELRLLSGSNNQDDTYDRIPISFRNKDTWLQKTNLLCSTCSKPIVGQPIPLPSYIVHDEHTDECVYKGITTLHHSWTCASMYNTVFKSNNEKTYSTLKHLYQLWENLPYDVSPEIPNGLPYTDQIQYGGKLSEQQWEAMNKFSIKESLNRSRNNK